MVPINKTPFNIQKITELLGVTELIDKFIEKESCWWSYSSHLLVISNDVLKVTPKPTCAVIESICTWLIILNVFVSTAIKGSFNISILNISYDCIHEQKYLVWSDPMHTQADNLNFWIINWTKNYVWKNYFLLTLQFWTHCKTYWSRARSNTY